MKILSLARWAALAAIIAAPLAASADDQKQPGEQPTPTEEQAPPPAAEGPMAPAPAEGMKGEAMKTEEVDQQVLSYVHALNQRAIASAKLAEKNATRADIKKFAKQIVKDHEQADKALTKIAKEHKIKLVKIEPTTDEAKMAARDAAQQMTDLKKAKGAEFDRQFLQMQAHDQGTALTAIEANVDKVAPDIRTYLLATKPVLQQHADMAKKLEVGEPQAMR